MTLRCICLIVVFSCIAQVYTKAQPYYNQLPGFLKANGVWIFGEQGGINLNKYPPEPVNSSIYSNEQCASVADSVTGALLFYAGGLSNTHFSLSDTGRCWNRNHNLMPNGSGLKGVTSSGTTAQGYSIVPMIDSPGKYYLFSLNYQGITPGLYYSVVDMALDNGLGDIDTSRKNIVLDHESLSEAMVAVPGNNCDVWLLVHTFKTPIFKAYRIHAGGIDAPVISEAGPRLDTLRESALYSMCNMAVSPDRKNISLVNNYTSIFPGGQHLTTPHTSGVHLFLFDPWTGKVSDHIRVHDKSIGYGTAFSPDNSKLYVWMRDFGWSSSTDGVIRQFDIRVKDSATIAASATEIITRDIRTTLASLRLYRDTIYVSTNANTLDRINDPNTSGTACDYQPDAVTMNTGQRSVAGLPSEVVYPYYGSYYFSNDTQALITIGGHPALGAPAGFDQYTWDNGSTDSVRVIDAPGTYWVISEGKCHKRTDTFHVQELTDINSITGTGTQVSIYPNPASTVLHMDRSLHIRVVSASGATMLQSLPATQLDISSLPGGLYWILLMEEDGSLVQAGKFMKI